MKKIKLANSRSLTFPIVMASVTVPLGIFVLVGWILVLLRNQQLSQQVTNNTGMMAAGVVSLITIITALVLLTVFLSREILESRRQSRFIDSITHELKSPLASIRLCTQTLERANLPLNKRHELQQMMIDDIDRLSFFIDDILQANRIANGVGHISHAWVNPKEMIEQVVHRICSRHHIDSSRIQIEDHFDTQLFTERASLEMIFRNLLDNAIKYSLPEPNVYCLLKSTEKSLFISIQDNGIGIPLPHQHRIFERFFRAPGEAVNNRSGTGLGLYVASQLVRNLGGKLKVQSEGVNRGSRFTFTLPHSKSSTIP